MRRAVFGCLILPLIVAGCGGPAPSTRVATVGPHQGRLLDLPDGLGAVEVVVENKATAPKLLTPEVVAYFLGPDTQTPLNPPPADVAIQVYLAESKTLEKLPLKPDAAAARFAATPPPGFDGTVRTGRITARLAGREVDLPF